VAESYSETIANYLRGKGSPLASFANDFVQVGSKYGIDPRFLVAISGIETSFGKTGAKVRNPFGYHSARKYSGPREVLELMGQTLTKKGGYYDGKNDINSIGATWAPPGATNDPNGTNGGWPAAVRKFYQEMGGNPQGMVKGAGALGQSYPSNAQSLPGSPPQILNQQFQPKFNNQLISAIQNYASQGLTKVKAGNDPSKDPTFQKLLGQVLTAKQAQAMANPAQGVQQIAQGTLQQGNEMVSGGSVPLITGDGKQPKLSKWGGPHDHGKRALGNWQSDLAYDLGGKAGTGIYLPSPGRVVKVGGQPGGKPQFRGYGVTIDHGGGNQAFYKHLGTLGPNVKAGSYLNAGALVGGLADGTGGGPHLHLGATSSKFLDSLLNYYIRGG